jgi:hypothetical protein
MDLNVLGKDGKDGINGTDGKDGAPGEKGEQGQQGLPGPAAETLIPVAVIYFDRFSFVSDDTMADLSDPSTQIVWTPGQRGFGKLIPLIEYTIVNNRIVLTNVWYNYTQANSLGLLNVTVYQSIGAV